ncbi:MAG: branched chain amino acid ABC transporter substrate-binding protein [Rickettsiales bacterium]|nr:branched chain amino acid ABC transporter substrate-binding protein [Rickettsiales bacterium]OUW04483.1 MAG: branched chain amino acid ABC transporter substrate-binding protein [Betaproteobacteria bacterium TMED156]
MFCKVLNCRNFLFFSFFFTFLFTTGCSKIDDGAIKIGHVAPLTGNQAHLGKDNEAGAKIAIKDLNQSNITIDGKKAKFILISEDDAADPKQGTSAAQKLVDSNVAGVIGHLNSGTTMPASTVYNRAGIPQISPSATLPKYTKRGYKTAFRVVANDVQLGGSLGRYAFTDLKAKTAAIIDDRSAYGAGVAAEFKIGFEKSGGKIIENQYTNDKSTDFFAILTSIKSNNPDIIFFGGMDAVAGPMIRQIKQLNIKKPFLGGDGICTAELPKLAGKAIGSNKVFCAEAGGLTDEESIKKNKDFRERFERETGYEVKLYSPYVYDATMILVEAMKIADSSDPKLFLKEISNIEYLGVTGPISFDEYGDVKNASLTIYTFDLTSKSPVKVIRSSIE